MADAENQTTKGILIYLQAMGWVCWRQNQVAVKGRRFTGKKGLSDIQALEPNGCSWFIEVKNPNIGGVGRKGKLSEDQINFKNEVLRAGHIFLTVFTISDLIEEFEAHQRIKRPKRRSTDN